MDINSRKYGDIELIFHNLDSLIRFSNLDILDIHSFYNVLNLRELIVITVKMGHAPKQRPLRQEIMHASIFQGSRVQHNFKHSNRII